ncbi:hypothetical protein [Lysobacter arvi]|nr:hypothetical protein [Lysobacter arvi]
MHTKRGERSQEDHMATRMISYSQLVSVIGEGAREIYGADWNTAERAAAALWKSYEQATGLSWEEVEPDVRAAWERACLFPRIDGSLRLH